MKKRLFLIIPVLLVCALLAAAQVSAPALLARPWEGDPDYGPLEREIRAYLAEDPATYGIYFLDLTSGKSFGINPDLPLPQASTVKLPIALYVYHLVAQGKVSWTDRVAYHPETDYRSGAGALQFFAPAGATYSLRTLTNLALTLSDNVAKAMLVRYLGADNLKEFMAGLGASSPRVDGQDPTTARDMAIYLQEALRLARERPELGERLLDDLSHTIWHVGLPGELPPSLQVAHKEGDLAGVANDVGIVFASRPYILCVLSRGQADTEAGFAKIARLSRMVYDYQRNLPG